MEGKKNGGRISSRGREGGDKYESDLGKTLTTSQPGSYWHAPSLTFYWDLPTGPAPYLTCLAEGTMSKGLHEAGRVRQSNSIPRNNTVDTTEAYTQTSITHTNRKSLQL